MKDRFIKLIPLLIVILFAINLVWVVATTDVMFMKSHIFGLIALSIVIIIQLIDRETGYYATLFMLVIGVARLVAFTPSVYFVGFASVKIDPVCFLLLIIAMLVHRRLVARILREFTKKDAPPQNSGNKI